MLRSLESMKLYDLNTWVSGGYAPSDDANITAGKEPPTWYAPFSQRMSQAQEAEVSALDLTVAELFDSKSEA